MANQNIMQITPTAQAQFAAAGKPTQGGFISNLMNALGYGGAILKGMAEAPTQGPGMVITEVANRYNERQYNKQQAMEKAAQEAQIGHVLNDLTHSPAFINGFHGTWQDANNLFTPYGNRDFAQGANAIASGQPMKFGALAPAAQVGQALKDYTDQQQSVANMLGAQQNLPQFYGQGQQGGKFISTAVQNSIDKRQRPPMPNTVNNPQPIQTASGFQLPQIEQDPALSQGNALQATAQDGPQAEFDMKQVPRFTGNPFGYATDIPTNTANTFKTGVENTEKGANLAEQTANNQAIRTETTRHNKATESQASREETAKEKAGYYTHPASGTAQNPFTIPNSQAEYVDKQVKQIDNQLKAMGVDTSGELEESPDTTAHKGGYFGIGEVSDSTALKNRAINALIRQRSKLLGMPSSAFGGGQTQKLEAAGNGIKSAADWKKEQHPPEYYK